MNTSQGFAFGGISLDTSKKLVSKILDNPLLSERTIENSRGNLLVLVGMKPTRAQLKALEGWLYSQASMFNYRIVLAANIDVTEEEMKKGGIARFFKRNGVDIRKYSYDEQVILPLGRALYAVTRCSDIYTACFYDFIFNKTHFYSQTSESEVYPVDDLDRLFKTAGNICSASDSFRKKFADQQLKNILREYDEVCFPRRVPEIKINVLQSKEAIHSFFEEHKDPCMVSWDLETTGLNFVDDRPGCITLAFNSREGFYLPLELVNLEELNLFMGNKKQVGQNIKFDDKFARRELQRARVWKSGAEFNFNADEDTLILAQVLNENRANGLKSLAYYYSPFGGYDSDLDDYLDRCKPATYMDIPLNILSKYATMDAVVTFWVWEQMQKQLSELDLKFPPDPDRQGAYTLREYYEKIRMPAYRSFLQIEERGIYVDKAIWDKNSDDVQTRIVSLQRELYEALRVPIYLEEKSTGGLRLAELGFEDLDELFDEQPDGDKNLSSNKKLGELLLWNRWPNLGVSKTGDLLTGDEQLTQWEKKGFKIAATLKLLRSYRTLQKTFIGQVLEPSGWRNHLRFHPEDNSYRIHPTYRVMGAESGRNTCDSPNWQQIPSHGETARYIKEIISVPNKDEYFLATLDYSSLQIRLVAIDSNDKALAGAYRKDANADLHSITGYSIFAEGKKFDIDEVVVNVDGKERVFLAKEDVSIIRNGKHTRVLAEHLKETDIIEA